MSKEYEAGYQQAYAMKARAYVAPAGTNSNTGYLAYMEGYKAGAQAKAWEGKGREKGLVACAYLVTLVRVNAQAGVGA